jgi:hypothetical protein
LLFRSLVLAAAASTLLAVRSEAQFTVGLAAGVSQFDLSGTGSANVFAARVGADVKRWLVLEGSVATFRPTESLGKSTYYVPEAQLQAQVPARMLRPYVGVGGGYFVGTSGRPTRGTASLSGGLRAALGDSPAIAQAELRVRGIGEHFGGSTAEWTIGLGWRF